MKKLSLPTINPKVVISILVFAFAFLIGNEASSITRASPDDSNLLMGFNLALESIYMRPLDFLQISQNPADLKIGFIMLLPAAMLLMTTVWKEKKRFHRKGQEQGSAQWGTHEDIEPFMEQKKEDFSKNIILSQSEYLSINTRKTRRNANIMIVGGSGSGKTRFYVKPNLLQMHSSYVVTDPKGTILEEVGQVLANGGYAIKSLNLIDFNKSLKYNPFAYVRDEKDILKLVNCLITNTSGEGEKAKEDFWVKAERLLLTSLIAFIWYEAPAEEQNFTTLTELINECETKEDDEEYQNPVDILFLKLEEKDPEHFAVRQYKKYKLAAGKTAKSILISVGARLAPFDIKQIRELTAYDEMELDTLGDKKTALFVIIPDTDATFNFIAAMMYSQMFDALCYKADNHYHGRLPIHVRCLLDEFANIGMIPNFEKLIATIRSREISACPILQSESQLKGLYKDHADTIIGNCDTYVFLGGKEKGTLKGVSEMLGKETIDQLVVNESRGKDTSSSLNYAVLGRELLTASEVSLLKTDECIVSLRGCPPFLSKKYDLEKHPNFGQTADADPANRFIFDPNKKASYFENVSEAVVFDLSDESLPADEEKEIEQSEEEKFHSTVIEEINNLGGETDEEPGNG